MTNIKFRCDRCNSYIAGQHTPQATVGFYVVSGGTWAKYGNDGDHFVCDACVQSSPEYQADYGPAVAVQESPLTDKAAE